MLPAMATPAVLLFVSIAIALWSVGLTLFVVYADIATRRSALHLLNQSLFAVLAMRKAYDRRERTDDKGFGAQL